jgi:hypothetical protein
MTVRCCEAVWISRQQRSRCVAAYTELAAATTHQPAGCCSEKLAALIEHGLFDYLIRLRDDRLRNCRPQRPGGLRVDDLECRTHVRSLLLKFAERDVINPDGAGSLYDEAEVDMV